MKVLYDFMAKQVDLLTDTGLFTNMAALLSSQVTVNHFCGNLMERERERERERRIDR